MFICICKGITDQDLKQTMSQSQDTPEMLAKKLGLGTDCGTCLQRLEDLVNQWGSSQHEEASQNQSE